MSDRTRTTAAPSTAAPIARARRLLGHHRALETVLLASTACLLAAVAWPIASAGLMADPPTTAAQVPTTPDSTATQPLSPIAAAPTIQLALLLDTSSSMDGLIDQARTQLWSVVNALDGAQHHGVAPRLEIAVYEYGNDTIPGERGWIRQVQPFTSELDKVSQALFSLTTNGGTELAGVAIQRSLDELEWRDGDGALRVIYIAGNEEFEQGLVPSRAAIDAATAKGVVVNTVYCGSPDDSAAAEWRLAATNAGGRFASIDHNHVERYIAAPQDAEIARLGQEINSTYIHYGAHGRAGRDNMVAQDNNMEGYGAGSVVQRSVSKGSGLYRNDSWDLVDAIEADKLDYGEVDRASLPESLQHASDDELREQVEQQRERREQLQTELAELGKQREAFIAAERADDPEGLDQAILGAIREQAAAAGFELANS